MSVFAVGAFVYPQCSRSLAWDIRPIISWIEAPTLHSARRILVQDLLNHGFNVKETRLLTEQLSPFDQEEWTIS
jgi:hypothetical protein